MGVDALNGPKPNSPVVTEEKMLAVIMRTRMINLMGVKLMAVTKSANRIYNG